MSAATQCVTKKIHSQAMQPGQKAQHGIMTTPGYVGIIISGRGWATGAGCVLIMLMTVGFSLRYFNSRCIWHQEHHTQKQEMAMSLQSEPCTEQTKCVSLELQQYLTFIQCLNSCKQFLMHHTLILYLFRIAALRDRTAGGGINNGISQNAVMLRLQRSHNGRQVFSPNLAETVQARHGQHQNP